MPSAKILIIEDERITAMGIKHKLERLGYSVLGIGSSGKEAIEKTKKYMPDLILMDIILKGETDGIDTAKKINQDFNIPIVYLTAYSNNKTIKRAKLTNPFGYITKPFNDSELKSTIELAIYKNALEMKLKESKELYHNFFNHSLNGVALHKIVTDNNGQPVDYIFLEVNPAFEKITGLRSEDIIGKKITQIFPYIKKTNLIEKYGNMALKNDPTHFEEHLADINKFYEVSTFSPSEGQLAAVFSDITKRKLAETTLNENKKKYKDLTELLPQIICESDKNGIITFCNQVTYDLTGYSKEDFDKGLNIVQMVIPEDVKKVKKNLNEIIHGKKITGHEYTALRKNGSTFPVNIYSSPIIQNDEFKGLRSLIVDITEVKNMEISLKESKEMYKALIKASPEAVIVTNLEGIITFVSPRTLELSGFKNIEDILGRSVFEFIAPKYKEKAISDFYKVQSQSPCKNLEYVFLKADGSEYIGELNISIIKNNDGETESIIGTLRNITQIKKAREILKENEEKYRTLFNSSPDYIILFNVEGKLIDINRSALKITGLSSKDLIGKHFSEIEILPKEDLPLHQKKVFQVLKGETIEPYESKFIDKSGKIHIVETFTKLLKKDDDIFGFQIISHDITDRKNAEYTTKKSELYCKTIFENTGTATLIIEDDTTISLINTEGEKLFGYKKEDIEGKMSWKKFVLDDYIEKMEEYHYIRRINPNLPPRNYEFKLIDRYDNIKDILLTVALIPQTKKSLVSLLDITNNKKSRKALQESEEKYRQLVENAHEGIWSIDSEGITTFVNPRMAEMIGYDIDELIGEPIFSFIELKNIETAEKYIKRPTYDIRGQKDLKFIKKDGKTIYTSIETSPILDDKGNNMGILALVADISKRKKAEEKIKASLKEKEILLKEIHHRVKNNLQIISSLLNLQTGYINDSHALDVFKESQNRVKSMAMIHEKLYRSESMVKIDFGEYVTDLTENLFYNYKIDRNVINHHTKIDNIFFDINTAIPCGLIINELVTNCLKHAFSDIKSQKSLYDSFTDKPTQKNEINIELIQLDDYFVLTIADNGIGFPDDTNFRNTNSLGLQLVNNLVEQLDGTIKLDKTNGTKFRIIFKELKYKERT